MFCVHLCGRMKMFLYSFVRGTFLKFRKKRQFQKIKDVSLRNSVFNECQMWMYAQLGHKEDEPLFFDRIIFSAKIAWKRGDHVLQDFASFFSHYFQL